MKPNHARAVMNLPLMVMLLFSNASILSGQNIPDIKFQVGHSDFITSISWSPHGKYLVTGGADAKIKIWESFSGRVVNTLSKHTGGVTAVSWNPDSRYFASASTDGTVIVWDPEKGEPVQEFFLYHKIKAMKWSPRDNLIACGIENNVLKILEFAPPKKTQAFQGADERFTLLGHDNAIGAIDWSPDGKYVVSADNSGKIIIWEAYTGKQIRVIDNKNISISTLIWTKDSKSIVSGEPMYFKKGSGKTLTAKLLGERIPIYLKVWDASTGELKRKILVKSGVSSLVGSPDGRFVAVREFLDDTLYIININSGKVTGKMDGNNYIGMGLAWSPEGRWVATGGSPGIVNIWHVQNQQSFRNFLSLSAVIDVSWSPDGNFITYTNHESTKVWNAKTLRIVQDIKGLRDVSWSEDSNTFTGFLSFYKDTVKTLMVFKRYGEQFFPALQKSVFNLNMLKMSPSGKFAAMASVKSDQGVITILDLRKGSVLSSWAVQSHKITALDWSPDEQQIVTSISATHTLRRTGDEKFRIESPTNREIIVIWNVASGEKAKVIQKGLQQSTTILFKKGGGQEVSQQTKGHKKDITSLSWSPDGKYILSAGKDGIIKAWDYKRGEWFRDFKYHYGEVSEVQWRPDGKQFLSGGTDHSVRIWDLESGMIKEINPGVELTIGPRALEGHKGTVNSVCWDPKGKYVLSGSDDNTAKIWKNGKAILNLVSIRQKNEYMAFTYDGFYSASYLGTKVVHYELNGKVHPFDQFDIQYNRPDILVKRLNPKQTALLKSYQNAYRKRLAKMGFNAASINDYVNLQFVNEYDAPEIQLIDQPFYQETDQRQHRFRCSVRDRRYRLRRLNVWVNGIPVYGRQGLKLSEVHPGEFKEIEVDVALSNGLNVLEYSVQNEIGIESLKQSIQIEYTGFPGKPKLYYVGLGVGNYRHANQNFNTLQYPAKDVRDVAEAILQYNKQFNVLDTMLFIDKDAGRQALELIRQKLLQSKVDDMVILFFNGHGILADDLNYYLCTYHTDPDSPADHGIKFQDFESLLDGIPARRKLLLLDACYSGEADPQPADFELMKELFRDFRRETGAWIISSSGMSKSLEGWFDGNKSIRNGVFSYALIKAFKGIRGGETLELDKADADNNGLQVSELKDYIIHEVVRISEGVQKPTIRRENSEFNFTF